MELPLSELWTLVVCAAWLAWPVQGQRHKRERLANGSPILGHIVKAPTPAGKDVEEYYGIPYAEPPVGQLRFKRPQPKAPWTEILNCTVPPKSCWQTVDQYFGDFKGASMWNPNTPMDEDCLFLNVWVPYREQRPLKPFTVMVWIFGGGFFSGTSTLKVYDGRILATEENVIVVSMNYRVTLFGFLYTGREDAPGNMGLLDQQLALRWVKENIRQFGGNPDDVTIFGESAGGASVSFHTLAPSSRDLFKRAIVQSGSATAPWALETREVLKTRTLMLSEMCSCNVTVRDDDPDLDRMMECLLATDVEKLLKYEWTTFEFLDFPWTAVVDGSFLVEDPVTSLKRGAIHRGEVLGGTNLDESMYFIVYYLTNMFKKELMFTEEEFVTSDEMYVKAAQMLLPKVFSQNPVTFQAILHEYKDWQLPGAARRRQDSLDKMLGDYHFSCNVLEYGDYYQLAGVNVYMYYFTHRSSQIHWPRWMGVLHGYEIEFIFGLPLNPELRYQEGEKDLARRMMRYWANFARTGNPNLNVDGSTVDREPWPVYTTSHEEYLTLADTVHPAIGNGIRRKYCAFWKKYLPKLVTATSCDSPQNAIYTNAVADLRSPLVAAEVLMALVLHRVL